MEEIGIDSARKDLGGIVDRARLRDEPTVITRAGKPAAVVVSVETAAFMDAADYERKRVIDLTALAAEMLGWIEQLLRFDGSPADDARMDSYRERAGLEKRDQEEGRHVLEPDPQPVDLDRLSRLRGTGARETNALDDWYTAQDAVREKRDRDEGASDGPA